MGLNYRDLRGTPLDRQVFTWRELAGLPYSKLDDDAFTRIRVILMNGIEAEAVRFSHAFARVNQGLRGALARVRRIDHHQQTLINWLHPPDQSVLETTIGYEQTSIELTAHIAQREPDAYLAEIYRFGLLEDFDHLYRYSALMDRVEGKDASNILQRYTDVRPGRPTRVQHRDPTDDLRQPYDRRAVLPISKLNAIIITGAEHQARDYYLNVGPTYPDPLGRQLYAEIASIEEQHVTQYESLIDPGETWLEKWLLHEATEVQAYWSCAQQESNPRLRALWERFLDYELGHLHFVMDLMRQHEDRDPETLLPEELPDPIRFESQRDFIKLVIEAEVKFRALGTRIVSGSLEPSDSPSARYRDQLNRAGSPSELVAAGYRHRPGTELLDRAAAVLAYQARLQ